MLGGIGSNAFEKTAKDYLGEKFCVRITTFNARPLFYSVIPPNYGADGEIEN